MFNKSFLEKWPFEAEKFLTLFLIFNLIISTIHSHGYTYSLNPELQNYMAEIAQFHMTNFCKIARFAILILIRNPDNGLGKYKAFI